LQHLLSLLGILGKDVHRAYGKARQAIQATVKGEQPLEVVIRRVGAKGD